jgi:hypothetical protein
VNKSYEEVLFGMISGFSDTVFAHLTDLQAFTNNPEVERGDFVTIWFFYSFLFSNACCFICAYMFMFVCTMLYIVGRRVFLPIESLLRVLPQALVSQF